MRNCPGYARLRNIFSLVLVWEIFFAAVMMWEKTVYFAPSKYSALN
jgi:hypothetical protein